MFLAFVRGSRPFGSAMIFRASVAALAACLATATAHAQSRVPIARDAEAEALLNDYLAPILKAAGIPKPKIHLVPRRDFNAFVAPGNRLFVNAGTIVESETPNEVIGVLAHEIGHLAANDPAQLQQVIQETKTVMMLAGLLSIGAAAAGSAVGSDAAAGAGATIFGSLGGIGARVVLRYKRGQEAAADRAAVNYLNATGQSSAGMLTTLSRLANQSLFATQLANPYLQSHPFPRERAITIENLALQSPIFGRRDTQQQQARHDLVRAKLVGFTMPQGEVYRRYPLSDQGLAGRYARAISEYRSGRPREAHRQIDQLIASAPRYPYFHELKGQALLESGQPAAAVPPLRRAVELSGAGLINIMLGQALVATGERGNAAEAIRVLKLGLRDAPRAMAGYHSLARAYAVLDDIGMAQLVTAEGMVIQGNLKEAKIQATRAQAKLNRGSPPWLRADDIVSYKP